MVRPGDFEHARNRPSSPGLERAGTPVEHSRREIVTTSVASESVRLC